MLEIPPGLLTELEHRRCVLFAGAGLSAQAGLPTWKQFARQLVTWAQESRILPEKDTSWMHEAIEEGVVDPVVYSIATALGSNLAPLHEYLRQTFLYPEVALPEAYTILTRLPFQAALTGNFDDLLEEAFKVPPSAVLTPRDARELLVRSSSQEFYILKLYGSLDRPESLILSPQQSDQQISGNLPFSQYMEGLRQSDGAVRGSQPRWDSELPPQPEDCRLFEQDPLRAYRRYRNRLARQCDSAEIRIRHRGAAV